MAGMSLSTVPVFKCRVCGVPVEARVVETYRPDPDGILLRQIMQGLSKLAMCGSCRAKEQYYQRQGRAGEFTVMSAPAGILVAVRDYRTEEQHEQNEQERRAGS